MAQGSTRKRQPRRAATDWKRITEEWRASGQSAAEYAEERGLSATRLRWWATKIRREDRKPASNSGRTSQAGSLPTTTVFAPIRVVAKPAAPAASDNGRIEVVLGNGRVVRVIGTIAPSQLGAVLQIAETGEAC